MTVIERQSERKKKAILYLIERGEYSLGYALLKVEELYDAGKLTEEDYEYLADYIEDLLNKEEETPVEEEVVEEIPEEVVEEETEEEEGEE